MTDADWLRSGDPGQLLGHILKRSEYRNSPRKLTLIAAACALEPWRDVPEFADRVGYVVGRWADGEDVPPEELAHLYEKAERYALSREVGLRLPEVFAIRDHRHRWPVGTRVQHVVSATARSYDRAARARQCVLLRDVFGNPFRPVAFDPSWRTSSVLHFARQLYEGRDFAPMPILADALQEAGCDHPDVLAHCRGDGPHVRGCWVVDRVLGKA